MSIPVNKNRVIHQGLLALSLILPLPALAQNNEAAPAVDGMTPAIAECLQKNAAAVEAAEPDLTKATDYLVADICAQPVAEEQRRITAIRTEQVAQRNRAQCQDRVAQQKSQDAALTSPPRRTYENCELNYTNQISNTGFVIPMLGMGVRPPAVISMAARLILERRLAHNQSRP
jgi:hypothetical protein